MKLFAKLEKSKSVWYLLATLFGFFLLRLPSLFEPYWYGDEGIYEVIGYALRHGRLLYAGIWDNKPPLLYLMFALFNGSQSGARLLSLLFGLGSVLAFFFLAKKLFAQSSIVSIITALFAFLFGIPMLEGNIANAENFMVLPILLAGYIIVRQITHELLPKKYSAEFLALLLAGMLVGVAFLFKIVAIFDLGAFALFSFIIFYKSHNSFFVSLLKAIPIFFGFAIPILVTVFYFAAHRILGEFIHATFNSNIGYVNYGNQFIIPQGFLILKLLLLGAFSLFVLLKKNKFSVTHIFVSLWLAFSLFNAFFSQRPYTHYLLVLLTALCLFVGVILTQENARKKLFVFLLFLVLVLYSNFWIYNKSLLYYGNFLGFITGTKSVLAYRSFFDTRTQTDYDIAAFFKRHAKPSDQLFVWGDDGQIYVLAGTLPEGRFIVAYHMTMTPANTKETATLLEKQQPKFIVILPNQPPIPHSLSGYSEIALLGQAVLYERDF